MDFQSYVKLPKGFVHKSSLTSPGHMELQLGEKHPSNPAQSSPIHNPPAFIKTWCPVLVYLFSLSSSNPLMGCYRRWKIIGNCRKIWKNLSQGSESKGVFLMLGNCSETSKSMLAESSESRKIQRKPMAAMAKIDKKCRRKSGPTNKKSSMARSSSSQQNKKKP